MAIPDIKMEVVAIYQQRSTVVVEFQTYGTMKNIPPDSGLPDTIKDKPFTLKGCDVMTIENGKVKKVNSYWDLISVYNQMGWKNIVPGH